MTSSLTTQILKIQVEMQILIFICLYISRLSEVSAIGDTECTPPPHTHTPIAIPDSRSFWLTDIMKEVK